MIRTQKFVFFIYICMAVGSGGLRAGPAITFDTVPAGGSISGPPWSTVGWGYTITNQDPSLWVSADALNTSAGFTNGSFDSGNFDFPIIAPGSTVMENFLANTTGLAEFSWNMGAPLFATNSGVFELSLSWYTQDPVACGFTCLYAGGAEQVAITGYEATASSVTTTPEPNSFGPLAIVLAIGVRARRQRRKKPVQVGGWRVLF